jgi:hypothetical protein
MDSASPWFAGQVPQRLASVVQDADDDHAFASTVEATEKTVEHMRSGGAPSGSQLDMEGSDARHEVVALAGPALSGSAATMSDARKMRASCHAAARNHLSLSLASQSGRFW